MLPASFLTIARTMPKARIEATSVAAPRDHGSESHLAEISHPNVATAPAETVAETNASAPESPRKSPMTAIAAVKAPSA